MLDSLILSLEIVLPLFLLMAVGYGIKLTGMMNETTVKQVNKVIFKIFLPLLVFVNIYDTELAESFNSQLLLYAVSGVAIQFVLSLCLAILLEKDNSRRGVMLQGMFRSNFVLFGIPISTALFGDTAAGLASILIAVIIPLYNVLAVISLEIFNGKKPNFGKILLGIVTNPLIIGSVLGVLFVVFALPVPDPIAMITRDLGRVTSPLALVFIGMTIQHIGFEKIKHIPKEVWLILFSCFVLRPVVMYFATGWVDMSSEARQVFIVSSSMPVSSVIGVLAKNYGADEEFCSEAIGISTLALLVALPLVLTFARLV